MPPPFYNPKPRPAGVPSWQFKTVVKLLNGMNPEELRDLLQATQMEKRRRGLSVTPTGLNGAPSGVNQQDARFDLNKVYDF